MASSIYSMPCHPPLPPKILLYISTRLSRGVQLSYMSLNRKVSVLLSLSILARPSYVCPGLPHNLYDYVYRYEWTLLGPAWATLQTSVEKQFLLITWPDYFRLICHNILQLGASSGNEHGGYPPGSPCPNLNIAARDN